MSSYTELKERHQQETNAFPMAFAFSNKQFIEAMAMLGLTPEDTDKVYRLSATGGIYRRTDASALHELLDRHEKERQDAIAADSTGDGYIYEMFCYELANHEYGYTGDLTDTLEALDLTPDDFEKSEPLKNGLLKAIAKIRKPERRSRRERNVACVQE